MGNKIRMIVYNKDIKAPRIRINGEYIGDLDNTGMLTRLINMGSQLRVEEIEEKHIYYEDLDERYRDAVDAILGSNIDISIEQEQQIFNDDYTKL